MYRGGEEVAASSGERDMNAGDGCLRWRRSSGKQQGERQEPRGLLSPGGQEVAAQREPQTRGTEDPGWTRGGSKQRGESHEPKGRTSLGGQGVAASGTERPMNLGDGCTQEDKGQRQAAQREP